MDKLLEDEMLEEVSGGKILLQHTNFCPRCRSAAYIVLHELTHAVVMKAVGGGKVNFGFTGLYAFAGSREDYFDKTAYRCIALAPLVLWGIVFAAATVFVPRSWFWVVWFLQAGNIGGAAGDVYVTVKLWNKPASILVMDTGVDMTVFDC